MRHRLRAYLLVRVAWSAGLRGRGFRPNHCAECGGRPDRSGEGIIGAGAGCSVPQCARIRGDVDGVLGKHCEGHDLKRPFMSGGQDDMGGRAIVMSSQPVSCRHAPAVSRHQPRELELRNRRRQVVADAALVLKELSGHHGADRVASPVFWPGVTASITVEAGDRIGATWLQLTTDHIAITHVGSIRASRRTRQACARVHPAPPSGTRRSWRGGWCRYAGRQQACPALGYPASGEARQNRERERATEPHHRLVP